MAEPPANVPFFAPGRIYEAQRSELDAAFSAVLSSGRLILGPEVELFERELAFIAGSRFAIGVASGTDALELALRALELPTGAEVLCPALTATATGTAIVRAGCSPVLVDIDPHTLTIDPERAASAMGSRTAALIAVHLYGRAAPVERLGRLGSPVVEDAAHAHGLVVDGQRAGSLGMLGCFSFYPTKNLGAFGDAGAVSTSDASLATRVRELRVSGESPRSSARGIGANSRLDELQAALLRVRLGRLAEETERRNDIAGRYDAAMERPSPPGVHHLYVVRSTRRDELREWLGRVGIQTGIHYPRALSEQPAFAACRRAGPVAMSEAAAREVLSIPCHAHLTPVEVERVASTLAEARTRFDLR